MEIRTQSNDEADVAFLKRMMVGLVAGTIVCASGLFASVYEITQEKPGGVVAEAGVPSN